MGALTPRERARFSNKAFPKKPFTDIAWYFGFKALSNSATTELLVNRSQLENQRDVLIFV